MVLVNIEELFEAQNNITLFPLVAELNIDTTPPQRSNIIAAIGRLKSAKASGLDSINAELL